MRYVLVFLLATVGCNDTNQWSASELGFDGNLRIDGAPFVYLEFGDYFAVMAAPSGDDKPESPLVFFAVSDVFPSLDGLNFRREELEIFQLHATWFDVDGRFLEIPPLIDWTDWLSAHAGSRLFFDTHSVVE